MKVTLSDNIKMDTTNGKNLLDLLVSLNEAIKNDDLFSMQILGTRIETLGYKIVIDTKH